ncbi:MAG TPA: hypothetical protein VIS75_03655, partial [Chitinophagaceae bacterium]
NMMSTSGRTVIQGGASMTRDVLGDGYNKVASSMANYGASGGYFNDNKNNSGNYMKDKLSGNKS